MNNQSHKVCLLGKSTGARDHYTDLLLDDWYAVEMLVGAYQHILFSSMNEWDWDSHMAACKTLLDARGQVLTERIPLRLRSCQG
jgi:hypothetical protein